MARPRINVDESRVIELASNGYRMKEIAAVVGVSHDTLTRRFAQACEKGHELMRGKLRAKQLEVALKGNPVMLIWLGKQELQQADKQEFDVRKQVQVQMVVGINQSKLNKLTQGYFERQLPENTKSQIETDVIEMDESTPAATDTLSQKENIVENQQLSEDGESDAI